MDVKNFIDSVASGNAVEAKESLNDLLSSRAFEAIDAKKVELAQSLFADNEVETQDTEATAEE
jgi:thymidine phosphorylase